MDYHPMKSEKWLIHMNKGKWFGKYVLHGVWGIGFPAISRFDGQTFSGFDNRNCSGKVQLASIVIFQSISWESYEKKRYWDVLSNRGITSI